MLKAQAVIETSKASRYLKALCNHFDRKVSAQYTDSQGTVEFGFADCKMKAVDNTLIIDVQAENDDNFNRVKFVVGDHLIRFSSQEIQDVNWDNQQ